MESQQIVELLLSMQARMKMNQDDLLKTVKEEMQATIGKMKAGIHSIQSDGDN
jgi:hypothetical protein